MRSLLVAALVVIAQSAGASGLTPAFEAAVERSAEVQSLLVRRGEIEARRRAAGSFIPAPPAATLGATTDWAARNKGSREYEAEVSAPVWLPGERGATRDMVDADGAKLEAEIALRRLDLARMLRDAYWDVAERRALLALAIEKRDSARSLADDTRRRAGAGLSAQLDTHLAEADLHEAEAVIAARRTDLDTALIVFRTLTGTEPPDSAEETVAPARADAHPRLILPRRAVAAAEADSRLTRLADRDPPEVGLVARTERGDREESYATSFGIRIRIPFAGEQRNAPRLAVAESARTAALLDLAAAEREVEAGIAKAQATFTGAERLAAIAEARHAALQSAFDYTRRAAAAGQTGFAEMIRQRGALFEAANARAAARIAVARARAGLNQAHGIEP